MGRPSSPNRASLSILVALAIAAGFALPGAASADSRSAPSGQAERVSYADLDLDTTDGARLLLDRLHAAARTACGPEPVRSPLLPRIATHHANCVTGAVDAAVTSLDAPLVFALHTDTNPASAKAFAAR